MKSLQVKIIVIVLALFILMTCSCDVFDYESLSQPYETSKPELDSFEKQFVGYTMNDVAAEFLSEINETIDIIILAEESTWQTESKFTIILDILQNYSAASGDFIRVQFVNPDLDSFYGPLYNNSLSVLKDSHTELEGMNRDDIIILSSRKATRVFVDDLFFFVNDITGKKVIAGLNADRVLVNALSYVLNETIARAVFIENHQENSTANLKTIFQHCGYVYSDINLTNDDIPDDTAILVSAGAKLDFSTQEIMKLENYLSNGGSLMILYDFYVKSLPLLDMLLLQWGVSVDEKQIFDNDYTFVPQHGVIGAHVVASALPFTADAEKATMEHMPFGVYLSRPLSTTWVNGSDSNFTLFPLIQTFSASSYAKVIGEGNTLSQERENTDESGPFVIAYNVRSLTINPQGNQVFANLIVTGANMFEDGFLNMYGEVLYNKMFIADFARYINPNPSIDFIPSSELFE